VFYRLLPSLLSEGKVYIAESPLYEITTSKDIFFAYNEPEKAEIVKSLGNTKYTLQRSKGLGENEPDMMWKTTMNPASRRLIRVTPDDAKKTAWIFETLLGDDLESRKEFITAHGAEYLAEADI
jgi:DNA gyrase subunit B